MKHSLVFNLITGILYSTALLSITLLIFSADALGRPLNVEWRKIGDDLELAELEVRTDSFWTPRLVLLKSSLRRYRPAVVRAGHYGWKSNNVRRLAEASGAVVVINASFFDEHSRPLGLVINRGIVHNKLHRGGKALTGILEITGSDVRIVSRDGYEAQAVREAIQAGPRLVSGGRPVPGMQNNTAVSRRSGVCLDSAGNLVLFCLSGGLSGISLPDLQKALIETDCQDALNFDGGGSSQLYLSPNLPGAAANFEELYLAGRDDVPVGLGLFVDPY